MNTVTITPTEERVVLRLNPGHQIDYRTQTALGRWLERGARRKGRHINEPSLILETDYDVVERQTFLMAFADSFPDTMPDWLRTTPVTHSPITI